MHSQAPEVISTWTIFDRLTGTRTAPRKPDLEISNVGGNDGEVILDYGRCEEAFRSLSSTTPHLQKENKIFPFVSYIAKQEKASITIQVGIHVF